MNGLNGSAKWTEEMSEGFWRNIVVRCSLTSAVIFVSQEGNLKKSLKKKRKNIFVAVEQIDFISEKSERLLGICT